MPNYVKNVVHVEYGPEVVIAEMFNSVKTPGVPMYPNDPNSPEDKDRALFDFNKVIPMPEELDIESGSKGDDGKILLRFRTSREKTWNAFAARYKSVQYMTARVESMLAEGRATAPERTMTDHQALEASPTALESMKLGAQYKRNRKKWGAETWYDWRHDHWGTKWNASNVEMLDERTVSFETAWASPVPVLVALSNAFPDLYFSVKFADEDIGSNCGCYDLKAGELSEYDEPLGEEAERFACDLWGWDYDEWLVEVGRDD